MKVSVVITAHNRKQFIREAVASVRGQNNQGDVEILVSRDFEDRELAEYLREQGVIDLVGDRPGIGAKIEAALNNLTGEVVSFLEDDDLYLSNRIDLVIREFSKDRNLAYLRNSIRTVNQVGKELPMYPSLPHDIVVESPQDFSLAYRELRDKKVGFNLSSVSVSRESLEEVMGTMRRLHSSPDTFLLVVYLSKGFRMKFSREAASVYRIHSSSTIRSSGDFYRFRETKRVLSKKFCEDWFTIVQAVPPQHRVALDYDCSLAKVRYALYNGNLGECKADLHSLYTVLIGKGGKPRPLLVLSVLSPNPVREMIIRREWRREENRIRRETG